MLSEFIQIRKKITTVSIAPNEIVGTFVPTSEEVQTLKNLSSKNCIENFALSQGKNIPIEQLTEGQEVQVKLYPLQLGNEKYFENTDELLKATSQKYPDNRFYVFALDYDSASSQKPEIIEKYELTTQLISFLTNISDYQKERELVFFQAKQLVLITNYELSDWGNLKSVPDLITHISNSADKEERRIIFTNEMIATLGQIPETNNRFKHLLKNFEDLLLNYKRSHTLYLEKYSYQKFKSEIDKEIIEYSKKIQSVINDAQGKLVAIPAAFLLIVGQFDLSGEKLHLNFALLLSSFVFSVLLEVLLRNQFSALSFVKDDIDRFKNSVDDKKISVLGADFAATFEKIFKLHKRQKCYLNIIRCLVWLTPFFAIGLLILSLTNNTFICFLKSLLDRL